MAVTMPMVQSPHQMPRLGGLGGIGPSDLPALPLHASTSSPDQSIQLRWTSHQPTVFSIFQNLLDSESMVDVTLAVEGKYLRAHKIILSACSPYFQELLSLDSSKHPILFMSSDTKFKDLKAILTYMYKGETFIRQEDLPALLKLAESLQVRGLAETRSLTDSSLTSPVPSNSHVRSPCREPPPVTTHPQPGQPSETTARGLDENSPNYFIRQQHVQQAYVSQKSQQRNLVATNDQLPFQRAIPSTSTSNPYKRARHNDPPLRSMSGVGLSPVLPHEIPEEITSTPIIGQLEHITLPYIPNDFRSEDDPEDGSSPLGIHPGVKVEANLQNQNVQDLDESNSPNATSSNTGSSNSSARRLRSQSVPGEFEGPEREGDGEGPEWNPQTDRSEPAREFHSTSVPTTRESEVSLVEEAEYFVCPKGCGRKYLTQSSALRHVRVECGQPATLICPICKRDFKYKHRLYSHLKNIHQIKN